MQYRVFVRDRIRELNIATMRADLVAGVTVALVLIPQSMAYAQLAGLPAHYGLYAALLPPMIASIFGSSRQLATGPVAVVSLMTATALEPIAIAGSQEFISYAILLALMVGIFQLLLGVLRLGLVVNFLSHPVVNGFTCAAALIIATSQLPKVFGVQVDKAEHHYETVTRVVFAAIDYTHWPTLGMAVLAFGIMIILKRINPKIPNVLVAVVLTTVLSAFLGFQKDEVVALSQIHSSKVTNQIEQFNKTVDELDKLQLLRAEGKNLLTASVSETGQQDMSICARCHTTRSIEMFGKSVEGIQLHQPGDAVALHQKAGLFDELNQQISEDVSELRTSLRNYHFGCVTEDNGDHRFYLPEEMPDGTRADGAHWRLKVGAHTLDQERIVLIGGGAVVGDIPRGLPAMQLPLLRGKLPVILQLIPARCTCLKNQ